jgi:mannose-6-phosphate isomerase-like protein (cupin superfamily)
VAHRFGSLDGLGSGPGFRKIREPLGVTAFGVNAVVYPPRYDGFLHWHDEQDELYFVHRGRVVVEAVGEGGLFHAEAATRRKVSNPFDEEAVLLVVGGKGGYVGRDGHLVHEEDLERRRSFSSAPPAS